MPGAADRAGPGGCSAEQGLDGLLGLGWSLGQGAGVPLGPFGLSTWQCMPVVGV